MKFGIIYEPEQLTVGLRIIIFGLIICPVICVEFPEHSGYKFIDLTLLYRREARKLYLSIFNITFGIQFAYPSDYEK